MFKLFLVFIFFPTIVVGQTARVCDPGGLIDTYVEPSLKECQRDPSPFLLDGCRAHKCESGPLDTYISWLKSELARGYVIVPTGIPKIDARQKANADRWTEWESSCLARLEAMRKWRDAFIADDLFEHCNIPNKDECDELDLASCDPPLQSLPSPTADRASNDETKQPIPNKPTGEQDEEDQPEACEPSALANRFSTGEGNARNDIGGFDRQFSGIRGQRFKGIVQSAASEYGLNPGCLAASALSETGNNRYWLQNGPVDSALLGLDFWRNFRRIVGEGIFDSVVTNPNYPNCTIVEGKCHFINENGRDTGPIYQFPSGSEGMRATAAWLRELENRMQRHVGAEQWASLPQTLQCALTRLSFNPGQSVPNELAASAVDLQQNGGDPMNVIPTDGPIRGSRSPARTSGIRAAQAGHLSSTIFDTPVSCP